MSEVALLQIIGLCVVGLGIAILLFIKSMFVRVVGFVVIVLGSFSLIALGVPQMASLPPAIETFDIASVQTPDDLVGTVVFLASPESDFITGQCIVVNGGDNLY